MSGPKIIIAEKNQISRTRMARALEEMAHPLEATGSAAYLMQNLLHGELSVIVLGDGLEEGLSVATLVSLLKSCDPDSTIIHVSDDVHPLEEIKMRQQGIFYRMNRPICALGWDELQLAVECACNRAMLATMSCRSH
ncbi:MAG: hypothetical protein KAU27_01030 [Desulfuromonadales bacterium]|nr:hypothetical protein [Desulfuromonadales bacterium]